MAQDLIDNTMEKTSRQVIEKYYSSTKDQDYPCRQASYRQGEDQDSGCRQAPCRQAKARQATRRQARSVPLPLHLIIG